MPVSTTASPVTQVADVAVKKASIIGMGFPEAEAGPRDNKNVPKIIIMPKPNDNIFAGVSGWGVLFFEFINEHSPRTSFLLLT
ncbi:hypothetical protein D3C78_1338940 [compost metagenome]